MCQKQLAVHLDHHMSTKYKEYTANAAKSSFWKCFNLCISDYGFIYSILKNDLLGNIAAVTMGHLCGHCKVMGLSLVNLGDAP